MAARLADGGGRVDLAASPSLLRSLHTFCPSGTVISPGRWHNQAKNLTPQGGPRVGRRPSSMVEGSRSRALRVSVNPQQVTQMNAEDRALWDRIAGFAVDDGGEALSFANRLARENAWTVPYATRVIAEYKRFMFLAVAAGHPVTPSDQVDQAWHLHLAYTRSYWDRFCGQVLQRHVHHGPTRGGPEESRKFRRWYQDTVESYQHYFVQPPPPDIWPDGAKRFGEDLHLQRVNTKRHWVIRKPGRASLLFATVLGVAVVGALATTRGAADHDLGQRIAQAASGGAGSGLAGLIFTALGVGVIGVFQALRRRCDQCGRFWAVRRNGAMERIAGQEREEWGCKYCGRRNWRKVSGAHDAGCGAGGCAADGGGGCGD